MPVSTVKNSNQVKKPVRIWKGLHRKLKVLAFNKDVSMEELTSLILSNFLSKATEEEIGKVISELRRK